MSPLFLFLYGLKMDWIKKILLYIWQFPQNLLGLLVLLIMKPVEFIRDTGYAKVYSSRRMSGSISLGQYSCISYVSSKNEKTIRHEGIGHARQSRMLGPLYLVVIGPPSILWAALHNIVAPRKSYYWFCTEKWADRLGGVER